jgi:hypothetical protein
LRASGNHRIAGGVMERSGSAVLPLHGGHAPSWLVSRMKNLAAGIVAVIVDEYGRDELLLRLSDPFWFQSLGCVLGYDWHSSGVTTVLTGVLRETIDPTSVGVAVCGGKGKRSKMTPAEIHRYGSLFDLSEEQVGKLEHASRLAAKVDNAAIQAGYPLYHHAFFMTLDGKWSVIQQGIDASSKTARRYHWLSEHVQSFTVEPHDAIVGDQIRPTVLNMTSKESEESRKVAVDLVRDGVEKVKSDILSLRSDSQKLLTEWMAQTPNRTYTAKVLNMPRHINWSAMRRAYEFQPADYEELLSVPGIGAGAVRALALISQIIYGAKPSWRDPVKFSFALGGKDGVPFPVDRSSYDQTILHLSHLIEKARLEGRERYTALQRLKAIVPN